MPLSQIKKVSVVVAKYAVAASILTFFFSVLKNRLYVNPSKWDSYTLWVALIFLAIGFWASKVYFLPEAINIINPVSVLSKREMQVLDLLCQQKTNQQIADELCIELSTLKTHINRIYKKMEVKNRRQLIKLVCSK